MESIFYKLDKLMGKPVNESSPTRRDDRDEDFKTKEQGEQAAIQQIASRILKDEDDDGSKGMSKPPHRTPEIDDDPFKKSKGGGKSEGGEDTTFRSHKFDGFDDDFEDDSKDEDFDDDLDDLPSDEELDDFEFDDFDYEVKDDDPSSEDGDESGADGESGKSSGRSGSSSGDTSDEDGDFEDEDFGDEDDYDFGDGYDDEDGDESGADGSSTGSKGKSSSGDSFTDDGFDEGEPGDGMSGESKRGKSDEGGKGGSRKSSGGDMTSGGSREDSGASGSGEINYDDTLDYDSEDDDNLEGDIKDALDRTKADADGMEKKMLDDIKKSFEDKTDGKSSTEKGDKLSEDIKKATDESKKSGELPGESLSDIPSDKEFEEEMKKGGFSDKDIDDMKKSKNSDPSDKIDEDKIHQEAIKEMEKKVKDGDISSSSSLSKTIMRSVLDHKITNMEWKEMVKIFLDNKSKNIGTLGKTTGTSWGHKNHLWRGAIMPKTIETSGSAGVIYVFIDFSGSVSEPLVKVLIRKVLSMCEKLVFDTVKVYGFGQRLSKPYDLKKSDIGRNEDEIEKSINKMWDFIREQNLGGAIENFEAVSLEIAKIKRLEKKAPVLIFGDGLWALSYDNPKPPIFLKTNCSRHLKDLLVLVYYYGDIIYLRSELGYLKHMVGIENIVTTEVDEFS